MLKNSQVQCATGPNFFAVVNHFAIDPKKYDLPRIAPLLYMIEFTVQNLENPQSDPIGVYFYAGIRRYVWRDKFWSDYEIPVRCFMNKIAEKLRDCVEAAEAISLRKLLDIAKEYKTSYGPTSDDKVDNPSTQIKTFYRSIYEIPRG